MAAIPSDLDAEKRPRKWLFCPTGYPALNILTRGWQSGNLGVSKDGDLDDRGGNDFPEMEPWLGVNRSEIVSDFDGTEYLAVHCRIAEVWDDFDESVASELETPPLEAWPDALVADCWRATALQDTAAKLAEARRAMPKGFEDDTLKIVLDKFVVDRLTAEYGEIDKRIAQHRKNHPDPERIEEPGDEEDEDVG